MIDILVQKRKDKQAAKRFFKKLLKSQETTPFEIMTDKLKSYGAPKKEIMPSVTHIQDQYANNQAENFRTFRDRAFADWSKISCT